MGNGYLLSETIVRFNEKQLQDYADNAHRVTDTTGGKEGTFGKGALTVALESSSITTANEEKEAVNLTSTIAEACIASVLQKTQQGALV